MASAILPVPFGGNLLALGISSLTWLAIIVLTVVIGWRLGNRWVGAVVGVGSVALCATLLNWVAVAPEAWFKVHRSQYEAAAESTPDPSGYDGERLPVHLMWLTVDGKVTGECLSSSCDRDKPDALFFPQWKALVDDAGGYIYSPDQSPEGMDMYGMICENPVDLGEGWWMCGM